MLQTEFLKNSLMEWGISILIIIGTIICVKLLSMLSRRYLHPFVDGTRTRLDDVLLQALEAPLKFAVVLLGIWIALHRLDYPDTLVKVVETAYRILIVLDITWVIARLASNLLQAYWHKRVDGQASRMMPVVRRSVLVVVWIIGLVMALSNVGVNISALLGTLGIGGIAFALAAQDTVKNVFGAFTILTDKPFSIGDIIRIDSYEGTVLDIGVRSVRLMNYDRRIITLPNYKVTDATIINISSEPMRRVVMTLGLTYDTSAVKMQLAMELLRSMPSRVEGASCLPSDVVVYFSEYADSALVITYIYFIEKGKNIQKVTSDMNLAILSTFNDAGLEFAFPTQTLYVQGNGGAFAK